MMSPSQWLLLAFLSVLWGGSFLFVGIAVTELPVFTIVLWRVGLAALLLLPVVFVLGHRLPDTAGGWWPFLVMALLNNVIPFSAIALGETVHWRHVLGAIVIASGLIVIDGRILQGRFTSRHRAP